MQNFRPSNALSSQEEVHAHETSTLRRAGPCSFVSSPPRRLQAALASDAVQWLCAGRCCLSVPLLCCRPSVPPQCPGVDVVDIASRCHVTARRVNQIVRGAGLRPAVQPKPSPVVLDRIIAAETARFGPNYGFAMLHGALLRLYPQWRFTRRAVYASLRRVAPTALRARRDFAHYRLRRGHYHAKENFRRRTSDAEVLRSKFEMRNFGFSQHRNLHA